MLAAIPIIAAPQLFIPFNNGNFMNIAFICSANAQRSPTAAALFGETLHEVKSAGIDFRLCQQNRTKYCTDQLLEWADKIFVFETIHTIKIMQFGEYLPKIVNLKIDDIYRKNDPELISILINHEALIELLN